MTVMCAHLKTSVLIGIWSRISGSQCSLLTYSWKEPYCNPVSDKEQRTWKEPQLPKWFHFLVQMRTSFLKGCPNQSYTMAETFLSRTTAYGATFRHLLRQDKYCWTEFSGTKMLTRLGLRQWSKSLLVYARAFWCQDCCYELACRTISKMVRGREKRQSPCLVKDFQKI